MKKLLSIALALALVITAMLPTSLVQANTTGQQFSDVKTTHWAYGTINELVKLNIISGYPDGTFKPSKEIRVDEFIKLTVTDLGHNPAPSTTGYWADPYIKKAKELKLIGPNEFTNYQRAIKREEMASIIVNAYTLNNTISQSTLKTTVMKTIKDYSLINDNYKDSVLIAYMEGLIAGKGNGYFDPRGLSTRAEASAVIIRLKYDSYRKPLTLNIPSTIVTVNQFSETGMTQVQQKYYAPINDKGNPVEEVITLHDEIKKIEKQDYGYYAMTYNPYGQKLNMAFYPSVEMLNLPTMEKIENMDMVLNIHDTYFKEGYYPYDLSIYRRVDHHSDMKTYYNYLDDRYGDFLRVYAEVLFEEKADYFLEKLETTVNNAKNGIVQEEEFILNDRKVLMGSNNSVGVYISDKISE